MLKMENMFNVLFSVLYGSSSCTGFRIFLSHPGPEPVKNVREEFVKYTDGGPAGKSQFIVLAITLKVNYHVWICLHRSTSTIYDIS